VEAGGIYGVGVKTAQLDGIASFRMGGSLGLFVFHLIQMELANIRRTREQGYESLHSFAIAA